MPYIRYMVTRGVPVFVYSGLPSPTLFPHTNMSTLLKTIVMMMNNLTVSSEHLKHARNTTCVYFFTCCDFHQQVICFVCQSFFNPEINLN